MTGEKGERCSAESESAARWYIEFFSAPLLALVLTPFIVVFILWSVKP
jgi:hypothetical protein